MSAGPLGVAVGIQHRQDSLTSIPDPLEATNFEAPFGANPIIDASRRVDSVFVEAVIPVHKTLELQLAVRREDHRDAGATTDPQLAFRYQPTDWLGFRGVLGSSFQAPTMIQTAIAQSTATISDPISLNTQTNTLECGDNKTNSIVVTTTKGGDSLEPQSSDNISLGVVFEMDALSVSVDYFEYDYTDLIAVDNTAQAIVNNDCNDGVANDPRINRSPSGQITDITSSFINTSGSVLLQGYDVGVEYKWAEGSFGRFSFSSYLTYVTTFDAETSGGKIDGLGSRNANNQLSSSPMPKLRGNMSLGWTYDNQFAHLGLRYIDSYSDDADNDNVIDSFTSLDLQYGVTFSDVWSGEMQVAIGAKNVLDEDPSAIDNRPFYDERVHNPTGREVYLRGEFVF